LDYILIKAITNKNNDRLILKFMFYMLIVLILNEIFLQIPNYAQNNEIRNLIFKYENEKIQITYDLYGQFKLEPEYNIMLKLLRETDSTFILYPKKVNGDIGENILPGKNKTIIWDIDKEFYFRLKGEDYYFVLSAEYKKENFSWIFYSLGAVVALSATTYALITSGDKKNKEQIANPPDRP